jgi:hypothetical protein
MLSKFKLQTLKQKLWAIVAASFFARAVMFFSLPSTPSTLAPDESTYASLTKWIGESRPADEFPAYGEGLYLSGRAMITPASFLYRLGLNELDAVRLVSTTYGLCTLILVVCLVLNLYKANMCDPLDRKFNGYLIVGLVFVFAFLPSHFVWSNLGLRESATEFWILATFGLFFILYHYQKRITAIGILALVVSVTLVFGSRPQVGWVVGVSLIGYLLLKLAKIDSYFMIALILCGIVLGSLWSYGSPTSTSSTSSITNVVQRLFTPVTNSGELVTSKQLDNQLEAASVIEPPSCPRENPSEVSSQRSKFDIYFCIAWRAPYMVSTFLFRPIFGGDVTSTSSLVAAFENLIWVWLFVTIFVLIIQRRKFSFMDPILPALTFFALYVLGASAYQGNMGTAFRHKSLILWVLLLVLASLAWRKNENPENNLRNNSQESAV